MEINQMKQRLLLIFLLFAAIGLAQEQDLKILKADAIWGKEIIKFPVEWAPGMTLDGFEELRFSPEWNKPDSPQFWSLVLAWKVKASQQLTLTEIKHNLKHYFDGLMKPNHWATEFPGPEVTLAFSETEENKLLVGKMRLFDGFHTGKTIVINMSALQTYCDDTGKTIVIFRFSPKDYEHRIWEELKAITLLPNSCP